jgi:HNH endonuclease
MSVSDREHLRDTAQRLSNGLREMKLGALNIKREFEVDRQTNGNGGWNIVIATWRGRPRIALTLDRFLSRKSRHFWFGFYSAKPDGIQTLIDQMSVELKPGHKFEIKDTVDRNGISILKQTPVSATFDKPIAEYYPGYESDFGMYDLGKNLDVDRAVGFIAGVVDCIENSSDNLALQLGLIMRDKTIDLTTRAQLIQARIGQGRFRDDLFKLWGGTCAVTGCTLEHVLRASHIKPWKDSTHEQRLDRHNGLLLSANLDALFDKHLISFDDKGMMLISAKLTDAEIKLLGLPGRLNVPLNSKQKKYLAFHRTKYLARADVGN